MLRIFTPLATFLETDHDTLIAEENEDHAIPPVVKILTPFSSSFEHLQLETHHNSMAPKPKTWAQVREASVQARRSLFQPTSSRFAGAAYNTITQRNIDNTTAGFLRRMETEGALEEAENPEAKSKKSKTTPKKSRVAKSTPKKKKGTAKRKTTPKSVLDDEPDNDEPESWRPYRDNIDPSLDEPTRALGIARIASWQFATFKPALQEKLQELGAEGDFIIATDEVVLGGEELMDVKAEFMTMELAERMLESIQEDGMVAGRKVQGMVYVEESGRGRPEYDED